MQVSTASTEFDNGTLLSVLFQRVCCTEDAVGLATNPNIVGGPRTSAGANANANMGATRTLPLCDVSVYVPSEAVTLLNDSLKHWKRNPPRYSDGVIVHDYCDRTCANLARGRGSANRSAPVLPGPVSSSTPRRRING